MADKEFGIWQSERSYRFKEEAIYNHAPESPGIYELVTFDEKQNPKVVFAEWVKEKTIFDSLFEHWKGEKKPTVPDLLARYPNLYFSFIDSVSGSHLPTLAPWEHLTSGLSISRLGMALTFASSDTTSTSDFCSIRRE